MLAINTPAVVHVAHHQPVHAHKRSVCLRRACRIRVAFKHLTHEEIAWTIRTARCESGGRWHIHTGNGFYGGLQFTLRSWGSVGGRGFPHQASKREQQVRGIRLRKVQGRGAWPRCGR